MLKSYTVTCNLIEIQDRKKMIFDIVKERHCVGFDIFTETISFYFNTRGEAMMTFLALEAFLNSLSVTTSPLPINKKFLKGVFKYD